MQMKKLLNAVIYFGTSNGMCGENKACVEVISPLLFDAFSSFMYPVSSGALH